MFGWFKKKKVDKEAELRASLAKSLENYNPDDDTTATTFTEIDFGDGPVRIKKVTIKADPNMDPWAENPADTTQWCKDEKKK
jgi:hypothetical protein